MYKINGNLLVDPTAEEEKVYDARLTVATDEKGTISAMQKGGEAPLSTDEISQMMDMAQEKATFLRGVLDK